MFREMRRKKQLLSSDRTKTILDNGITGILGVVGDEGYPYTIPLNYIYHQDYIYFHCAKVGHKLDALRANNKASFCVIEKELIVPEEFTAYFRSAVAFGKALEVSEEEEKLKAMRLLNNKYSPGLDVGGEAEIKKSWDALCVIKIKIEHLTGKESIELVKKGDLYVG